jgi:hypothetical protein
MTNVDRTSMNGLVQGVSGFYGNLSGLRVGWMLELRKKLAAAKSPRDREFLEQEVRSRDGEIDRLVYELYGLSPEEIAIVEGREK